LYDTVLIAATQSYLTSS